MAINSGIIGHLQGSGLDSNVIHATFLGASVTNVSLQLGLNSNNSSMSINMVADPFNSGDGSGLSKGMDIYHEGISDRFNPPEPGMPVFFHMSSDKQRSSEDVYKEIYNNIYYGSRTGFPFFAHGGILQNYNQDISTGNGSTYSATVVDPRQIMSSVQLILNNFAEPLLKNDNLLNIFGFLEYTPSASDIRILRGNSLTRENLLYRRDDGTFIGDDMRYHPALWDRLQTTEAYRYPFFDIKDVLVESASMTSVAPQVPMTGAGLSRRTEYGIPCYRVLQGLHAVLECCGILPTVYRDKFRGYINFRGLRYVLDFSSIPKNLPKFYNINYDQISLLDLFLEIGEITNHDLTVSLLPIIDHTISKKWFNENLEFSGGSPTLPSLITAGKSLWGGIIKLDFIDTNKQPTVGAIENFLQQQSTAEDKTNLNIGYELTDVSVDKVIVGDDDVSMYFFTSFSDRNQHLIRQNLSNYTSMWNINSMVKEQIIPYYGTFGNNIVTIPKGFGPWKQILLDSRHVNAFNVGDEYVTTEMELRAALAGESVWRDFLLNFNYKISSPVNAGDVSVGQALYKPDEVPEGVVDDGREYFIDVPLCAFQSKEEFLYNLNQGGDDAAPPNPLVDTEGYALPLNPCSPPYGYPLYYNRATAIGINGRSVLDPNTTVLMDIRAIKRIDFNADKQSANTIINEYISRYEKLIKSDNITAAQRAFYSAIKEFIDGQINSDKLIGLISEQEKRNSINILPNARKLNEDNVKTVYNFIRKIADECYGKKFLVKLPNKPNFSFQNPLLEPEEDADGTPKQHYACSIDTNYNYDHGAFGFYLNNTNIAPFDLDPYFNRKMLDNSIGLNLIQQSVKGGLVGSYNPIDDGLKFNYIPAPEGGYFDYIHLLPNSSGASYCGLAPRSSVDLQKLKNNNRFSSYVRFDHSETLDFSNMPEDASVTEYASMPLLGSFGPPDRSITGEGQDEDGNPIDTDYILIPSKVEDQAYNTKDYYTAIYYGVGGAIAFSTRPIEPISKPLLEPEPYERDGTKITFCKCNLDENIYFAPKSINHTVTMGHDFTASMLLPTKPSGQIAYAHHPTLEDPYGDGSSGGEGTSIGTTLRINDFIRNEDGDIPADKYGIDLYASYALITLPGKVLNSTNPKIQNTAYNRFNKYFDIINSSSIVRSIKTWGYIDKSSEENLQKFVSLQAGVEGLINTSVYSKIGQPCRYPDLACLAFKSTERCYGPWYSNKYSGIGAKVEFVRDTNLAPWNYNGYHLLNYTGQQLASDINQFFFVSERGGFSIPYLPSGLILNKIDSNIITSVPNLSNLDISLSTAGIATSYKFETYIPSFGKLSKSKQDEINKLKRNSEQYFSNLNKLKYDYAIQGNKIKTQMLYESYAAASKKDETEPSPPTQTIMSMTTQNGSDYRNSNTPQVTATITANPEKLLNNEGAEETMPGLTNTAHGALEDTNFPAAREPDHPNLPSVPDEQQGAGSALYLDDFELNNITRW